MYMQATAMGAGLLFLCFVTCDQRIANYINDSAANPWLLFEASYSHEQTSCAGTYERGLRAVGTYCITVQVADDCNRVKLCSKTHLPATLSKKSSDGPVTTCRSHGRVCSARHLAFSDTSVVLVRRTIISIGCIQNYHTYEL